MGKNENLVYHRMLHLNSYYRSLWCSRQYFLILSLQETDVVPDTRLLDKFSQITPQLFTRLDGAAQSAPLETLYIMDFFIALAICNTVVVSAPNQPRQKVKLNGVFSAGDAVGVYMHPYWVRYGMLINRKAAGRAGVYHFLRICSCLCTYHSYWS